MKLRILKLEPWETEPNEVYLMVAVQTNDPRVIITLPAILQRQDDESGHWVKVEIKSNDVEPISVGDLRAVSPEVQVPVYRKDSGERGEERRGVEGDYSPQGD